MSRRPATRSRSNTKRRRIVVQDSSSDLSDSDDSFLAPEDDEEEEEEEELEYDAKNSDEKGEEKGKEEGHSASCLITPKSYGFRAIIGSSVHVNEKGKTLHTRYKIDWRPSWVREDEISDACRPYVQAWKQGKVLQEEDSDDDSTADASDEDVDNGTRSTYAIQRILVEKRKRDADGKEVRCFQVEWEPTWWDADHMSDCKDEIDAFQHAKLRKQEFSGSIFRPFGIDPTANDEVAALRELVSHRECPILSDEWQVSRLGRRIYQQATAILMLGVGTSEHALNMLSCITSGKHKTPVVYLPSSQQGVCQGCNFVKTLSARVLDLGLVGAVCLQRIQAVRALFDYLYGLDKDAIGSTEVARVEQLIRGMAETHANAGKGYGSSV